MERCTDASNSLTSAILAFATLSSRFAAVSWLCPLPEHGAPPIPEYLHNWVIEILRKSVDMALSVEHGTNTPEKPGLSRSDGMALVDAAAYFPDRKATLVALFVTFLA